MFMLLRISKIQLGTSFARPAICLVLGIASLVIVSLIGHHQLRRLGDDQSYYPSGGTGRSVLDNYELRERAIREILLKNFSGSNIAQNLKQLTKSMHIAGSKDNELVAEFIRDTWLKQGLQAVHFTEYNDVLLSYPDYQNPNQIEIFDESGKIKFRMIGKSKVVIPSEQGDPGATVTFNAYSANGTAKGLPVYVNYGTLEDYELLDKLGVSLEGRIAIARYGRIWRGDKVSEAQKRGAVGVILYSDPKDFAQGGLKDENVYPNTVWMPNFGVQRGSLLQNEGDPLTPLYPALNYVTREYDEKYLTDHLLIPSIPVQPISYGDAWHILSAMTGSAVESDWQGGLNFTYRYGPGFQEPNMNLKMIVRTTNQKKSIRNVIGHIEGKEEPDRYVIVGNHYDAWVYGAVDPNSATATMLEMSRVFMTAINTTGWRPRRTIIFCAWDAEEYNLIGSTEWVEQFTSLLESRAMAYLNVDLIPGNETLQMESNPSLIRAAVNSAKLIPNPRLDEVAKGRKTVYDTWYNSFPGNLSYEPDFPNVPSPGAGSDHFQFIAYLGVPVSSFCYYNKSGDNSSYPLYHTLYETIYLVDKLMDPDHFKTHVATGQFWAIYTYSLADSILVPLNATDYAYHILKMIDDMNTNLNDSTLAAAEIPLQIHNLRQAAKKFLIETKKFYSFASELKEYNPIIIERLNSRLSSFERCFVNPRGNPLKRTSRHVIYGNSPHNKYKAKEFSSIYDQYDIFKSAKTKQEKDLALKEIKMQITIVQYSVECAIQTLRKIPH